MNKMNMPKNIVKCNDRALYFLANNAGYHTYAELSDGAGLYSHEINYAMKQLLESNLVNRTGSHHSISVAINDAGVKRNRKNVETKHVLKFDKPTVMQFLVMKKGATMDEIYELLFGKEKIVRYECRLKHSMTTALRSGVIVKEVRGGETYYLSFKTNAETTAKKKKEKAKSMPGNMFLLGKITHKRAKSRRAAA